MAFIARLALGLTVASVLSVSTPATAPGGFGTTGGGTFCVGDCNGDQVVTVEEVDTCRSIFLGQSSLSNCPPCDEDMDGSVTSGDFVQAENNRLSGCPGQPTFTPTSTPTPRAPTPTEPMVTPTATLGVEPCAGDCDGDGMITVDEIIIGVNIALGNRPVEDCPPFDTDGSSAVTVDEVVTAVNNALNGCLAA